MSKRFSIQIKRVYDAPDDGDGYRILVDRLWPRGVKKSEARLTEWNKTLAPSSELRKWFNHQEERFAEFSKRYQQELSEQEEELRRLKEMSETKQVTLLYGAKDAKLNQAVILAEVLRRFQKRKNE